MPARQLAQLYHQRWEVENGFAELKNRLRGAGFILRSKTPELICQEIYALLTVYQFEQHTALTMGVAGHAVQRIDAAAGTGTDTSHRAPRWRA